MKERKVGMSIISLHDWVSEQMGSLDMQTLELQQVKFVLRRFPLPSVDGNVNLYLTSLTTTWESC